MKKKLRPLVLSVALAASVATAVTTGAGTASAGHCGSVSNIFTMQADGDLWLYQHSGGSNGAATWAGARQVGWGWGGKTFAGPNGWLFNITTGGELRRLRYNGSGWDTFVDGRQFETIGWGWQKYTETAHRGSITVDSDGSLYTLEGDHLRWWFFDHQQRAWTPDSGRVIDKGWSRFNAIAASGQGGLKGRDAFGVLHHFRYDRPSERFALYETWPHMLTWQTGTKLFSPGGDIYYSVRPGTGELLWNDYSEYSNDGWRTSTGAVIGYDWGTDVDITATTSTCNQSGYWFPRNPVVEDQSAMPVAYTSPNGVGHLVRVLPDNRMTDLRDTGHGYWAFEPFSGEYTGISNVVPGAEPGTETFGTTRRPGGDVELITLGSNSRVTQSLKGAMRVAPSLVRRSDGTLVVYAMGDHGSDGGPWEEQLYYREQLANGDFLAWKRINGRHEEAVSVISRGNEVTIVGRTGGSMTTWYRTQADGVPVEQGRLPSDVGPRPKLVQTSQGRILLVDVGWRPGDGVFVLPERPDRFGFETTMTMLPALPGAPDSEGGQLDATVLPNGSLAVSLTAAGKVYVTTSKGAADGTEFHPWQQVSAEGLNAEFTEPTSMRMDTGFLAVVAVASSGSYWRFSAGVPQDPAAALSFTGRQLG
ncbi:tachylectin-related carbohydrate-binding protein [Lentzea sp. BCCO 10_0061]|uniref:Tachylectin-related carbohydrate-binding protein n=1 Tax=Lentzea sokolovensis TaxID=3095429 RepID=A0ABU4UT91_9PSEU|nr:tachylectin-related carbohydrate-binding protein [Lentzea sp. BCCO 10_0061]MDX8142021.1 tachylectin-related carbohydrate-binding protein [Lentzea sp. BCCO 10_0061]